LHALNTQIHSIDWLCWLFLFLNLQRDWVLEFS